VCRLSASTRDTSPIPDSQNSVARCAIRSSEIGTDLLTGPQSIYPFFDNKDLGGPKEAGENPARPRHCKRTELVSENVCSRTPLGSCPGKVSSWPQARRPGPPELIPTFPWGDGQGPRQVG